LRAAVADTTARRAPIVRRLCPDAICARPASPGLHRFDRERVSATAIACSAPWARRCPVIRVSTRKYHCRGYWWNSHAFNLYDEPADLDVWINFDFAAPEEQVRRLDRFVDITAIAKMQVPAYGIDEVCQHYEAPPNARLRACFAHPQTR
jgi:hypothetical protein